MSMRSRLAQGLSAYRVRMPAGFENVLHSNLNPEQDAAFRRLPAYDQAHLCRTYQWLEERGHRDRDLLQAALLHDLGKCALGGQVRLIDRALNVVLANLAPELHDRLATLPAPRWRLGLALTVHHPALGARWAAELGCSERTCWLIAHHADDPLPDDPGIRLLALADRSV